MVGRCAASQIASASDMSFFCRLTKGFTYAGAISRTVIGALGHAVAGQLVRDRYEGNPNIVSACAEALGGLSTP